MRRVLSKGGDGEESDKSGASPVPKQITSKIPNKTKAQDQSGNSAPPKQRFDFKAIKNMTIEEQLAANLAEIGPDGKPKPLSAYK